MFYAARRITCGAATLLALHEPQVVARQAQPCSHLLRDGARRCHICTGTGLLEQAVENSERTFGIESDPAAVYVQWTEHPNHSQSQRCGRRTAYIQRAYNIHTGAPHTYNGHTTYIQRAYRIHTTGIQHGYNGRTAYIQRAYNIDTTGVPHTYNGAAVIQTSRGMQRALVAAVRQMTFHMARHMACTRQ
jgi:hypothetical protein